MSFLGRLNYISQFIAQVTTTVSRYSSYLERMLLLNGQVSVKRLLTKLGISSKSSVTGPPLPGRPFLCLSVMDNSFDCILGQDNVTGKKGTSHLLLEQEVHKL